MDIKPRSEPRGGIDDLPPAPAIILCRPQMGENVGAAARAMLNFGLLDLRLVAPEFGWPNAKAVAACSGAFEVLNRLRIFPDLKSAAFDLHHLYATTARGRDMNKPLFDEAGVAAAAREQIAGGAGVGIVFGPERTGLVNDEIALADAILSIPLNPAFSSLNLSQAVLLCASAWFRSGRQPSEGPEAPMGPGKRPPRAERRAEPATKAEISGFLEHLLGELEAVGYFRSDDRRQSLSRTITMLFERRALTRPEVHLLRGIVKELRRGPLSPREPGKSFDK